MKLANGKIITIHQVEHPGGRAMLADQVQHFLAHAHEDAWPYQLGTPYLVIRALMPLIEGITQPELVVHCRVHLDDFARVIAAVLGISLAEVQTWTTPPTG